MTSFFGDALRRREDGREIIARNGSHSKSKALAVEGEMLWLTKITRSEMGIYLCIASNSVPPSVSKRIKLQVHCKYLSFNVKAFRVFYRCDCESNMNLLPQKRRKKIAFDCKHSIMVTIRFKIFTFNLERIFLFSKISFAACNICV